MIDVESTVLYYRDNTVLVYEYEYEYIMNESINEMYLWY
jgi:hypothetical protein